MNKKERLNKAYDFLRYEKIVKKQEDVAKAMGASASNVSSALAGREAVLTDNFLVRFAGAFKQISLPWLLNEEGDMMTASINFKAENTPSVMEGDVDKDVLETIPARRSFDTSAGVPYYNVDFQMGYDFLTNDQAVKPDYMIDWEPYNKCDCWCNARGDSMAPTIANGDIIAIKEVHNPKDCLISGEIYALVTTNDLRTIKRIVDNGDTITLVPDNKSYPEQTISKELILKVYKVMGSAKMF